MTEDKLTRDQRIALESVAQANLSMGMGYSQGDDEFDQTLVRAAKIERFIRKRDDDAIGPGEVPVLRDGDTVIVQPDKFTTQDEVDNAAEVWRREFGDRVQVTFLGWPVVAVHRSSATPGYRSGEVDGG